MTDRFSQPGAPEMDAHPPKRRTRVWWFVLAAIAIALVWFAWYHNRAVPTTVVTPVPMVVAPAASEPEAAASAPAPAPAEVPTAAPEAAKTYTVEKGDWLSLVFPNDWKAVCALNELPNCGKIEPDQVLKLPEGVEATEKSARAPKPKTAKAQKPKAAAAPNAPRVPKTNDAGEILYRVVGQAPLNGCGKRDIASISEEAWEVLGLSNDDRAYLRQHADLANGPRLNITVAEGRIDMPSGMRLEQVTFCRNGKVVARGPYRTDWADGHASVKGERFVLPSGKVLVWMRNCYNWVILPEEKTVFVPPPPRVEPPVAEIPPPPPVPETPEQPAPPVVAKAPWWTCNRIDPSAVGGREQEFNGADSAHSNFGALSAYCLTRTAANDGSHGPGAKLTASNWGGHVNDGTGAYTGYTYQFGPSYKLVKDEGRDYEYSVGIGRLVEKFSQSDYASERRFNLLGVSFGHNDYRRRNAGEVWWTEWQAFGTASFPTSRSAKHSWQGQRIGDTSELSRLDAIVNLGVRAYVHEDPFAESLFERLPKYVQAGLFAEPPTSASMSLRVGLTDPNRIVGVGAGVNKDIQNGGGFVPAAGVWVDATRGLEVGRSVVRQSQARSEAARQGITVKDNGGYIESIQFSDRWFHEHGYIQTPEGEWVKPEEARKQ